MYIDGYWGVPINSAENLIDNNEPMIFNQHGNFLTRIQEKMAREIQEYEDRKILEILLKLP